jgi:glutathione synthase/RimK-type ligase-like ATP-grasp enzyme
MSQPTVLLLTAAEYPESHPDDVPLVAAFEAAGWRPIPTLWDGPIPDADLAMVRSCWDYVARYELFLDTMEAVGERMPLWNPIETLRWNVDKRYLLELAESGVTIPDTVVIPKGDGRPLSDVLTTCGNCDTVIKPLVGGGGIDTWISTDLDEPTWRHAIGSQAMMIQRYLPEIRSDGEWSLTYINGLYSHAVVKRARAGEFRVQSDHGGTVGVEVPSAEIMHAADRALAAVNHSWLYARVDGVVVGGVFHLMELELLEPELYFTESSDAATKLVAAIT